MKTQKEYCQWHEVMETPAECSMKPTVPADWQEKGNGVSLIEMIKPQLEAMNEMYRNGYEAGIAEGKRQAWAEIKKDLNKIEVA